MNSRVARTLIPLALDLRGKWVTAYEVDQGIACQCVCPTCGGKLVAKLGETVIWHFAHAHAGSRGGKGCGEGSIHAFAKMALQSSVGKQIKLPEPNGSGGFHFKLARAIPEKLLPEVDRRVDILATLSIAQRPSRQKGPSKAFYGRWEHSKFVAHKELAIEINVSNPKDDAYINDMRTIGLSSLEIRIDPNKIWKCIREYSQSLRVDSLIRSMVLGWTVNKRWLYHPEIDEPK